jgi:hypothetical protein
MCASFTLNFGPRYWSIIHLTARRIDGFRAWDWKNKENGKRSFVVRSRVLTTFLEQLDQHLPCEKCGVNYVSFLQDHPVPSPDISEDKKPDEHQFFHWSVDAHNHANDITGKRKVSYDEATEMFQRDWMDHESNLKLSVSQRQRIEDHAKIRALESEMERNGGTQEDDSVTSPTNMAILISILVITIIAALVVIWLVKRKLT